MTTLTDTPLDLEALKQRQQATWASGDFAEIATLIVPVAERLCDAADLRAGSHVLDVATGSGNAAIAAARLGCRVTGIDYVPALLDRGRERAAAERLDDRLRPRRRRGDPVPRRVVRRRRVGLRVDVRARPSSRGRGDRSASAAPAGRSRSRAGRRRGSSAPCSVRSRRTSRRPPASRSPMLWGTERHLVELFGDDVTWTHRRRTFTFRFTSAGAFVETFVRYYGPTLKAVEAAGPRPRGGPPRARARAGTASRRRARSPSRAPTSSRSGRGSKRTERAAAAARSVSSSRSRSEAVAAATADAFRDLPRRRRGSAAGFGFWPNPAWRASLRRAARGRTGCSGAPHVRARPSGAVRRDGAPCRSRRRRPPP